jgi:hypothetical protein
MLSIARDNLGYAARGLRRSPGFMATVVVTLALGIGVNATMFGIVDRLLLSEPAQVQDADEVRRLYAHMQIRRSGPLVHQRALAYLDFTDWQEASSFESVGAYWPNDVTLGRGVDAVRLNGGLASASFFRVLGLAPELGRFFDESEDQAGAAGVTVLSYGLWQRLFGGDPTVLGRTLDIGRGTYTVIGVAPRGFTGLDLEGVDLWAPLHAFTIERETDRWKRTRNYYWIKVIARLADGVSVEAAENEATHLHRNGRREQIDQGYYDENVRVVVAPLVEARGPMASEESKVSILLAGVSIIVLLIACANVANLKPAPQEGDRRPPRLGNLARPAHRPAAYREHRVGGSGRGGGAARGVVGQRLHPSHAAAGRGMDGFARRLQGPRIHRPAGGGRRSRLRHRPRAPSRALRPEQ